MKFKFLLCSLVLDCTLSISAVMVNFSGTPTSELLPDLKEFPEPRLDLTSDSVPVEDPTKSKCSVWVYMFTGQEMHCLFLEPEVSLSFSTATQHLTILNQLNPVRTLILYFLTSILILCFHLCLDFPSGFLTDFVFISFLSCVWYRFGQSRTVCLNCPNTFG